MTMHVLLLCYRPYIFKMHDNIKPSKHMKRSTSHFRSWICCIANIGWWPKHSPNQIHSVSQSNTLICICIEYQNHRQLTLKTFRTFRSIHFTDINTYLHFQKTIWIYGYSLDPAFTISTGYILSVWIGYIKSNRTKFGLGFGLSIEQNPFIKWAHCRHAKGKKMVRKSYVTVLYLVENEEAQIGIQCLILSFALSISPLLLMECIEK